MVPKELVALCGRVALVMIAFAFVAGIIAGPLLPKPRFPQSITAAQDQPASELIRVKSTPASGGRG